MPAAKRKGKARLEPGIRRMQRNQRGDENASLDALLQAYRDACPAPDPSANFMPEVWRRIEERQRSIFYMARWARGFATAAAVLSLAMAAWLYIPHGRTSVFYVESFVEAISAGHSSDSPDLAEPIVDEL